MQNLCEVKQQLGNRNSDKLLHRKFVKFGNDRRKLTNELLVILPEIFARRIYKKYASSIEEYAAKFGGLTESVVRKRLRLEKHLEDNKPMLREAIRSEGINKVAIMASLVNQENEEAMVDKIRNMSKPALQELAKELRAKGRREECADGITMGMFEKIEIVANGTACQAVPAKLTIELDAEMTFMFLKIKKEVGKTMSNREVMTKILQIMNENLKGIKKIVIKKEAEKEKVDCIKNCGTTSVKALPGDSFLEEKADSETQLLDRKAYSNKNEIDEQFEEAKAKSRYIPAKNRKAALQKTKNHCAYPHCNRPPEVFHHAERFAESHSHKSIQPLCKIHHEFAHNGVIANEMAETKKWELRIGSGREMQKIDELYRVYRRI
ncbi:MAG: hypothetical protein AAB373_01020 [Patescibacteria group bacterium]